MIIALVGYQFAQCKVVFSSVILSFSWSYRVPPTSSEVVALFSTKFSNGKTLGGISVMVLDWYCYTVTVAATRIKLGTCCFH